MQCILCTEYAVASSRQSQTLLSNALVKRYDRASSEHRPDLSNARIVLLNYDYPPNLQKQLRRSENAEHL